MSDSQTNLVFSYDHFDTGIFWVVRCDINGFRRAGVATTRDRARYKVREAIDELRLVVSRRACARRRKSKETSTKEPEHIQWIKKGANSKRI